MLAPLSDGQRDHLVAAMAQVHKLLTASMVQIEAVDPDHAMDGSACARTSPSWTTGSGADSSPRAASRPMPTISDRPQARSWSPRCTTNRSAVARSSSTVTGRPS
jgi:hypothetical protein